MEWVSLFVCLCVCVCVCVFQLFHVQKYSSLFLDPSMYHSTDNMIYATAEDSADKDGREYEEIIHTHNQSNTQDQSQDHTYEFEGPDSNRLNENAYTEVGPFNGKVSGCVYCQLVYSLYS